MLRLNIVVVLHSKLTFTKFKLISVKNYQQYK